MLSLYSSVTSFGGTDKCIRAKGDSSPAYVYTRSTQLGEEGNDRLRCVEKRTDLLRNRHLSVLSIKRNKFQGLSMPETFDQDLTQKTLAPLKTSLLGGRQDIKTSGLITSRGLQVFRGAHSAPGRRGREENGQKREGAGMGRRGWVGDAGERGREGRGGGGRGANGNGFLQHRDERSD